jgi:hypothetical protein
MSYLDGTGLATLWAKIKQYVRDNATSSIPDSSVTASKLAQGAVTFDKLSSDIFVVEAKAVASNQTINASGGWYSALDISKSGYKPIGLVGWFITGTNARWCVPEEMYIRPSSNDVTVYIWNQYSGGAAVINLTISVLYMKIS